jgi:hypothetical protein
MARKFREQMAKMIVEQGDELHTLEKYSDGAVEMWYIIDRYREKQPQYQVWNMDKRCYIGTNRKNAYADFAKQKEEFIACWALI